MVKKFAIFQKSAITVSLQETINVATHLKIIVMAISKRLSVGNKSVIGKRHSKAKSAVKPKIRMTGKNSARAKIIRKDKSSVKAIRTTKMKTLRRPAMETRRAATLRNLKISR